MSLAFAHERQVAISAVRRACASTTSVFNKLVRGETLEKSDKSPVTVADYSAQAIVNTILSHAFPDDPIVSEEDAGDLRKESGTLLRDRALELANAALIGELSLGENAEWGIGPGHAMAAEELLNAIDRGNHSGGPSGRMWTLDPIDGTKGFLRGEQYAVCLALIEDAQVKLGVIGCPNLPVDPLKLEGPRGCLFVAVRGQGAEQMTLSGANPIPLAIPSGDPSSLSMLESVEATHSSHSFNNRVASLLGMTHPPRRMDSQAKYCSLARGDGGLYLRMPVSAGYQEKIWDHAAGNILVHESGGLVTDSRGAPLNFARGRTLGENLGIVAAGKAVHSKVLAAIQQLRLEEEVDKDKGEVSA